jgi:hypothetical protein
VTEQDLVIVNLHSATLAPDEVSTLWGMVFSFCVARGVDRVAVELDIRPPTARYHDVYERIRARLPDRSRTGALPITTPQIEEELIAAGPGLIAVNLCEGEHWWGGIYDWGHDIAVLLERSAWIELDQKIGVLSLGIETDLEEALERPRCPQN